MIRLEGAAELMNSLRYSKTLRSLDVSYNALGRVGSVTLGSALLENQFLEEILINNNSIDEVGWFTIAAGARLHPILQYIEADGNPIGMEGGRTLVKLARYHGDRLKFSIEKCDLGIRCSETILRLDEPGGLYSLDLSNPYHRAVALELLDIIALLPQYAFRSFEFSKDNGKTDKFQKLHLERIRIPYKNLDHDVKYEINQLQDIVNIAFDVDKIHRLFEKFDKDGSGELDVGEFRTMLKYLGIIISKEKAAAIVASVDTSGGCKFMIKF